MRRRSAPPEVDTVGRTENFWTRHVRLIAFFVAVALFLAFFIPFALSGELRDCARSCAARNDDRREMTVEDLFVIADRPYAVSERYLDGFVGDKSTSQLEAMQYINYQIYVGERYFLMASINASSGEVFYLTLTDFSTGNELDLLKNARDLEEFLSTPEN